MILNRTQQDATRELLELFGLTQNILAKAIDYGPSALSEALRPSKPKAINEEKWASLTAFFEAKVSESKTTKPAVTLRAEQLLEELTSGSDGPAIHAPGGRMPANAQNYVERQCDILLFHSRISNIADRPGNYPAVLVGGGIQSGRSSLMERLSAAAVRKGHDVRAVDLRNFDPESRENGPQGQLTSQVFRYIFAAFEIPETPAEDRTDLWVREFTKFAAKLDRHRFFIVDSADFIINVSPDARAFNDLVRLLIGIRDARPEHASIAVTYSARGWRYIHGSPYANAAFEVVTAPFTLDQVAELLRLLFEGERAEDLDHVAKVLANAFRGQPHLTHLAAFQMKNHPSRDTSEALRDVLREAGLRTNADGQVEPEKTFDIAGAYGTHWGRMRREIMGVLRQLKPWDESEVDHDAENRSLGELLRGIVDNSDREPEKMGVEDSTRVFITLFDRLKVLGLLDGPLPGLLSPFYRASILADPSLFRTGHVA